MRLNLSVEEVAREIFNELFSPEQIEQMLEIDLSEKDNISIRPELSIENCENWASIFDHICGSDTEQNNGNPSNNINLLLASYKFMDNCPGTISFYKNNIKLYVSYLIENVNKTGFVGLNSALYTVFFVIEDLITHESFHHYCDVKRQLTSAKFDINLEESLAVAHSYNSFFQPGFQRVFNIRYPYLYDKYQRLQFNQPLLDKIKNQNRILLDYLLKEHYNAYQANCYKNWHLHTHNTAYRTDFFNYIKNDQLDSLVNCGVPLNNVFEDIKFIKYEGAVIMLV